MLVFYVKVPEMKFHIQFFVVYDTTEDNWENLNLFFFFKSNITINLFKKNPWSLYTKESCPERTYQNSMSSHFACNL